MNGEYGIEERHGASRFEGGSIDPREPEECEEFAAKVRAALAGG